jgi:hypothetical protein
VWIWPTPTNLQGAFQGTSLLDVAQVSVGVKETLRMTRLETRTLCVAMLAGLTACGEVPQNQPISQADAAPGPTLQRVSFTGVADPATGRFQIFMGPQAAIGSITEDRDGSAATVTANTAQVYNPTAATFIAKGGAGFPASCSASAAFAMVADVEVWSGFKEQLRNVYVRINSSSPGVSFCNSALPGAIAPPAGSYSGLYFYQPLNTGTTPSAIRRMATTPWNVNIPSNAPFYFSGDLWAEVIPAPPTLGSPADNLVIPSRFVTISWTNDSRADNSNSGENYAVARPDGGAYLAVYQCGNAGTAAAPIAFNSALCSTTPYFTPLTLNQITTSVRRSYIRGFWYQWTLQTAFVLPGAGTTRTLGDSVQTRHFAAVR